MYYNWIIEEIHHNYQVSYRAVRSIEQSEQVGKEMTRNYNVSSIVGQEIFLIFVLKVFTRTRVSYFHINAIPL